MPIDQDLVIIYVMAKKDVTYVCTECGAIYPRMQGYCRNCDNYGTVEERPNSAESRPRAGMKVNVSTRSGYVPISKTYTVKTVPHTGADERTSTGVKEFDRLLQGGIVPGQVILLGAEPGFGKSTLCLEVMGNLASQQDWTVLYASGEESAEQIAERANRLNIDDDNLNILSTTTVEEVLAHATELDAKCVVVDSLQTMATETVTGSLGSISQSKEAAMAFKQFAKDNAITFILVSQFNKADEVAGSNQIAHIVDTIFLGDADHETTLKFLRSMKNRYGKTDEVAVFIHTDEGLMSVDDPSSFLIGDVDDKIAGATRTFMRAGARLLPVEIDALCNKSAAYGTPQRQFSGVNFNRGKIIIAALSKYAPLLKIDGGDVFVSTLNGVNVTDTTTDLAIAAAIVSSSLNKYPSYKTAWVGEVALTGRILGKALAQNKVEEAIRLGFDRIVLPEVARRAIPERLESKIDIVYIKELKDLQHFI